jgi:hypothetical protein
MRYGWMNILLQCVASLPKILNPIKNFKPSFFRAAAKSSALGMFVHGATLQKRLLATLWGRRGGVNLLEGV